VERSDISHPIAIARYDIHTLRRTPPNEVCPYADEPPVLRIFYAWFSDSESEEECVVVFEMGDKALSLVPNHWYAPIISRIEMQTTAQAKARANPRGAAGGRRTIEMANEIADRRVQTIAALRKARDLTQVQLADSLGIGQGDVSKLEQRPNVLLHTLARYVEATGGRLRLVAEYDHDRFEIELSDLTS
jgi:DNA-binding transcriptional regulator YiaG